MENNNTIIVDNIPLFCPRINMEGVIYQYNDIQSIKRNTFKEKIYFFTSDIDSVFEYTKKIITIFEKFSPMYVNLKDQYNERRIWFYQIPKILGDKRYEWKSRDWLLENIENKIERIKYKKKKTFITKDGVPAYLKLTLSFGIQIGGMVAHSTGVISELQKKYYDMPIFTTDYLPENIDKRGVRHISLKAFRDYPELTELYFNISAYKEIAENLSQRNISFIYQRYSVDNFVGVMLADRFRVPFILEFNSSAVWTARNWGNGLKYANIAGKIEELNLEKADMIVCVSDELKEVLIQRGIKEEKILVNYNGVDIKKYSPKCNGSKVRDKFNLESRIVIGFSGSFNQFHGAEKLAEAFGELVARRPEFRDRVYLLFLGDGGTREIVERKIKQFRMEDIAYCVGTVPFEEIQDYLAACDILVAPHVPNKDKSPFFGSPTKLFEYMAMGKAIIASNLNQIGEVLGQDCAYLVKPGNSEELSKAMEKIIEDKKLRIYLGESARKKVSAEYTWEKHVEKILNRLESI